MLLNPDVDRSHALSLFKKKQNGDYSVTIKSPKKFSLLVRFVASGCSFRQTANIVQIVREETDSTIYAGISDKVVVNYTRVACAVALQIIRDGLARVSGFSLAFDSSTLHGTSYLDVRARMTWSGELYNFHLIALPLCEEHSGALLCKALVEFLDALTPSWRAFWLGCLQTVNRR